MNAITGQLIEISQCKWHANLPTEPLTTFFNALVNTCDTENILNAGTGWIHLHQNKS
jgi:hypothetical protein